LHLPVKYITMNEQNIKKGARIALGAALVFAGVSHLTFARKDFKAQVPNWVPVKKDDTVVYSGYVEIALGTALILVPKKLEKDLGKFTGAFFTAVFPGNIAQYTHDRSAFGLNTNSKRFIRLLFQPVLVFWALKSTRNI